ncbi:MAG: hypothetical protein HZA54_16470 [Planctomycetes bacterium]|nr:hypothetical protein [Planctomycetota bacterium]
MLGNLKWVGAVALFSLALASPALAQEGLRDLESQDLVRVLNERDRLVSLSFTNAPVRSILQIMAQDADLNLIIPESVKGDLPSIELKRVSFKDAFLAVIRQSGIGARVEGDIITLVPQDAMQIATFHVNYMSMANLILLLTPFIQPGAGAAQNQGQASITPDTSSSTLIIKARSQEMDTMRRLITLLDTPDRDVITERDGVMILRCGNTNSKDLAVLLASGAVAGGGGAAGGFSVTADPSTNSLIISGNSTAKQNVKRMLPHLDKEVPRVMVEAALVSVSLSDSEQFGINFQKFAQLGEWATQATGVLASTASGTTSGTGSSTTTGSNPRAFDQLGTRDSFNSLQDPSLISTASSGLLLTTTQHTITMLLQAVQLSTKAQILAHPKVMAMNDKVARIQVGSSLGYLTSTTSATSTTQNVQFLDIGTILEITPHILNNDSVVMDVRPEVSNGKVVNGLPSKDTTTLQTSALVRDGHTLILGGLLQEKEDTTVTGIPLLSDIPYIGPIFQQRNSGGGKTEIVVMITPTLVRDDSSFGPSRKLPTAESAPGRYLRRGEGNDLWVAPNVRDGNYDQSR